MPTASQWLRLTAMAFGLLCAQASFALEAGSPVPDIELKGSAGQMKLAQMRGKVVYVDFWASWCAPCRRSFPWMNEIQSKYGSQGFQVIGINLDSNGEEARRFLASMPANFEIAFDPEGSSPRRFEVRGMPTSFLVGRDGRVLLRHTGFNDDARASLESAIQAALQGR